MEAALLYIGEGMVLLLLAFILKLSLSTRDELRMLNGRLTGIEAWREVHVKLVDERHENMKERFHQQEG